MLPQSSKKGIGTNLQADISHIFVPNWFNTSFVSKLNPIFSKNKMLTPVRHGFRSKHLCESQRLITLKNLFKVLKICTQTDVEVLYFSKAFDVVPHQRLLYKLDHYKIRKTALNWN